MIPFRDTIVCIHRPFVTWTLISINFAIGLIVLMLLDFRESQIFFDFGLIPLRYTQPAWAEHAGVSTNQYWPFLTNMFLHGGSIHLILNMWMLWIFGDNVEDAMGAGRFIAFYLLCGLIAATVHVLFSPNSPIPTVGASGAIAGLLGAYYLLYPYARIVVWIPILLLPLFVQVPAIAFVGLWVIIQLYHATTAVSENQIVADVAWWGHLGGFLAGVFLYRFFLRPEDQ